jgi:hypothetical protein
MAAFPFSHCTIQGVAINGAGSFSVFRRVDLISCTIKGIQIHNCIISDCQIDNCKLFNSTVKNSTIMKSCLFMPPQIVNCSLEVYTVTKSPLAFHKFPIEIRAIIFQYCLDWGLFTHDNGLEDSETSRRPSVRFIALSRGYAAVLQAEYLSSEQCKLSRL